MASTKQSIKSHKTEINALEGKLSSAKLALAKKSTKTAKNTLDKVKDKLKQEKQALRAAEKLVTKLNDERDAVNQYKQSIKEKEAMLKDFAKGVKPSVKPKPSQTTALAEIGLKAGDIAPSFTSVLETNKAVSLEQFQGKNIVLYFYPKDNTPGCSREAKDFSRLFEEFTENDTVILGVSRDSMASHTRFSEKLDIPYTLLADTDESISIAYGVIKQKTAGGRKTRGIERSTFLIDKQGIIQKVWRKVSVAGHADTILKEIKEQDAMAHK